MFQLYGPEPFFSFGPESVPVYLTGIRSCRSFQLSACERNNSPPLQKNDTEHTIAHNITSSKNREHLLFNYTMNMVHHSIIRPCLLQRLRWNKQNRHGSPTATPLSTSGYSGVVRFGRVIKRRYRLMGCIFWEKFGRRGV